MRKFWLLLLFPALLILWGILEHQQSIPEVHFATATEATIQSTIPTNGKVEPAEWAAARAEVAGVVGSIALQRGAEVKAGQVILTLDTTATQSELAAAQARLQEAQTEAETLKQGGKASQLANISSSIVSAQTAVSVAQRNYDSLQRLQATQAATSLQVQEARDALERAKQQLAAFQNQRQTLVTASDRTVAEARLRDAQAAVKSAQHRLALGSIRAPISGTLYQFDLKAGAYLQPGDLVGLVGNLDKVKVTVYVDEPDLGRITRNLPVEITWDARPGQKWSGTVERLPTQVIALGTRTVGEVTTAVEKPGHLFFPGGTVKARVVAKGVPKALTIPKAALRSYQGKSGVFRLTGKTLTWTPVASGVSDVNNVQIISGLHVGDKVADRVVDPSDAEINDGMRVNVSTD